MTKCGEKLSPKKGYRAASKMILEDVSDDEDDDPDAIKCVICYDTHEDKIVATKCGHRFHAGCIKDWCKVNKACPLCRTPL